MRIRAEVIDVTTDVPMVSDHLLVDSNVWFWVAYGRAETLNKHYADVYGGYLAYALTGQLACYRCPLSLAELSHSIERNEWEAASGTDPALSYKRFRRDPFHRQDLTEIVEDAWLIVEMLSGDHWVPLHLEHEATNYFREQYATLALDGYDLLMLHAMQTANLTQLLTDDADFGQVPDLQVFTANPYLIHQATQQGRLITRPTE